MLRMFSSNWFAKLFRPTTVLPALDIDWSVGDVFHKSISANTAFTFSNTVDGKPVTLTVINTSGASVAVTFPVLYKPDGAFTIAAGKGGVYTFIKSGSEIFMSFITDLTKV